MQLVLAKFITLQIHDIKSVHSLHCKTLFYGQTKSFSQSLALGGITICRPHGILVVRRDAKNELRK